MIIIKTIPKDKDAKKDKDSDIRSLYYKNNPYIG